MTNHRLLQSKPSILPPTVVLEMTYRCNHQCVFCYCPWYSGQLSKGRELTTDEWKEVIRELLSAGVVHFSFSGGEAILRDDLRAIIAFLLASKAQYREFDANDQWVEYEGAPKINLLSNGRALTREWIDYCAENQIKLAISRPGLRSFRANTGSDTDPERILQHFQYAKSVRCPNNVGIVVTKLNFPELYETIAAALLAGADAVLLNRFLPGGRGLSHPELELTADEIRTVADIAEEVLSRANRKGIFGTEMPSCLIDPAQYHYLQVSTGCGAVTNFFTVGPSGRIRGCNHSPVELVNVCQWRDLPENSEWMNYVRQKNISPECEGCAVLFQCLGGCREAARVTTGSPCGMDPVFKTAKIRKQ